MSYSALHTWEVATAGLHVSPPADAGQLTGAPAGPESGLTGTDAAHSGPAGSTAADAGQPVPAGATNPDTDQSVPAAGTAADAGQPESAGGTNPDAEQPVPTGAVAPGGAGVGRLAPDPNRTFVPQMWNVEAVDAAGRLLASWRGVRLEDYGPLPRHSAWPPTLLSVFLERSAAELGLHESLRVTVTCGQPQIATPQLLAAVPAQSPSANAAGPAASRPARPGRHAHPLNTVTAPGTGPLAGFSLTLRSPAPVACGWTTVEPGHRQRQPIPNVEQAYAQLRAELAEAPAALTARIEAIAACLTMAGLPVSDQLSISRTTSDGWAVIETGSFRAACVVAEISGVSPPVAIAMLTPTPARRDSPGPAHRSLPEPASLSRS